MLLLQRRISPKNMTLCVIGRGKCGKCGKIYNRHLFRTVD